MSKGVIGGVIGATIGFFAGGNVLAGWNIGYGIGSSYEVTKLPGLGDASAVEAGEGGPRFRVYGRFRPIGGQTIAVGPEVETRVRQRSKGGNPVESSRALRTYAIGFGEGPAEFSRIWEDTVLVYDARPNPELPWAESLKWAENVTFYTGDFEQMPDPALQEALGSGNVHGHRGTIYFVKKLEDYTDRGRRIASYQAELFRGRARVLTSPPYPILTTDSTQSIDRIVSGSLRPLRIDIPGGPDSTQSSGAVVLESVMRPLRVDIPSQNDHTQSNFGIVLGGEMREPQILANNYLDETESISANIISGTQRRARIDAATSTDSTESNGASLDGGLMG